MRRLSLSFAWYDLWVGAFYDRPKRTLYVCPLPCLLITIRPRPRPEPWTPSADGSGGFPRKWQA